MGLKQGVFLSILLFSSLAYSRIQDDNPAIVCNKAFLDELDELFEEYSCVQLGADPESCQEPRKEEQLNRRKFVRRDSDRKLNGDRARKISEYLKKKPQLVNPGLGAGVGKTVKYVFKKLGGFYLDSILSADSTANACDDEIHVFNSVGKDKIKVGNYLMTGVPESYGSCQMAFNIEGNKGLGNFYDLPSDKERLKILKNNVLCTYYYGIRERLEDEIFAAAKASKAGNAVSTPRARGNFSGAR